MTDASSPPLRILSYNIHKGFSGARRRYVLHEVRDAIRSVSADLVFLQEVLGSHTGHARRIRTWPSASQFEYLADSIWQHYAYGKNAVYTEGHHGNAILSKYPITAWSNYDISTNAIEQRGMLHAVVDHQPSGNTLHAVCVHLGLTGRGRARQLREICERCKHESGTSPLIVAGDFNDWSFRASAILRDELGVEEVFRQRHGRYARTFPAAFPMLSLDRIYSRGLGVRDSLVLTGKPWARLSDHAALFAEVEIA